MSLGHGQTHWTTHLRQRWASPCSWGACAAHPLCGLQWWWLEFPFIAGGADCRGPRWTQQQGADGRSRNLDGGGQRHRRQFGGSWFLSHLAYSQPFLAGLEQASARDQYNSTGYNGQVATLFKATTPAIPDWLQTAIDALPQSLKTSLQQAGYLLGLAGAAGEAQLSWRNFTDKFVFQPYNMLADLGSKGLDAARQGWAAGKDLLIVASAQTTPVVLDNIGLLQNKIFSATPLSAAQAPPQGMMTPLFS